MRKGIIFLLLSSFSFAIMTVFAKLITTHSSIPGVEITFFRFLTGFILTLFYMIITKQSLRPKKIKFVLLRAILNLIAVLFFFTGIQFTTVTNSNMLNMTYPIFVYLFAPFINKEKSPLIYYLFLLFTIIGIFLIVNPDINGVNKGDIFSLMSGIFAGSAISILREARKYDNSFVIIFYLMAIGSIINFIIMMPYFIIPEGIITLYILLTAILGVFGQIFLTVGYRYIDAASGSLVSSTRIVFACMLGISIFNDPLTIKIIIGGILILISLAGVSGTLKIINRHIFPLIKK